MGDDHRQTNWNSMTTMTTMKEGSRSQRNPRFVVFCVVKEEGAHPQFQPGVPFIFLERKPLRGKWTQKRPGVLFEERKVKCTTVQLFYPYKAIVNGQRTYIDFWKSPATEEVDSAHRLHRLHFCYRLLGLSLRTPDAKWTSTAHNPNH